MADFTDEQLREFVKGRIHHCLHCLREKIGSYSSTHQEDLNHYLRFLDDLRKKAETYGALASPDGQSFFFMQLGNIMNWIQGVTHDQNDVTPLREARQEIEHAMERAKEMAY